MKIFISLCIAFVLMSASALSITPPQQSGEFGAFVLCIPTLSTVRDVEDLGNFFVDPMNTTTYTITGDEFLSWRLDGPALDGYGNYIEYHVTTTNPENYIAGNVTLEIEWAVNSHNYPNYTELGGLNFSDIHLIDPSPAGGCDGYATFKINALTLKVYSNALPGTRTFYVSVIAYASI